MSQVEFLLKATLDFLLVPYSSPIFELAASILATAIVLFLTLSLIPIQQYAGRYSPSLLKYFKDDRYAILLILFLVGCMFFNIAMLFITTLMLHALLSATLLFLSFICLIFMVRHIIKMLSPADYLFPKIRKDCIETLKAGLSKKVEITPEQKGEQIEEQMEQILLVNEPVDPNEERWKVPDRVSSEMLNKMLPLKSMAMKLIGGSDYEVFTNAVQNIRAIAIVYFRERRDYRSFRDSFQFSLLETLTDLLRTAERNTDVYFTRSLFTAIKDIALATLTIPVLGSKSGYNHLTRNFCHILKERAEIALSKRDRDRAFDATGNLGYIGKMLAIQGMGHHAAEVASDLGEIAKFCAAGKDSVTLVPVRSSLAEIFFWLLWNRKLYPNYHIPYKMMLEVYELMLDIPSDPGMGFTTGDPLFGLNPELGRTKNLSALVYAGLISPDNDDNVVQHNLDVVKDIVEFIERHHNKDSINTAHFTNHIYQIGLWLLAFTETDNETRSRMILLPEARIPTEKNQEKAKVILVDLLKYMTDTYFDSLEGRKENIHDVGELLLSSLSLLYLSIHLNNAHDLGLTEDIDAVLDKLEKRLDSLQCEIDQTAGESLRIFSGYLDGVGKKDIAQKILTKAEERTEDYGSIHRLSLVDHIKRPIVTFDANLFSQFDEEISGQID